MLWHTHLLPASSASTACKRHWSAAGRLQVLVGHVLCSQAGGPCRRMRAHTAHAGRAPAPPPGSCRERKHPPTHMTYKHARRASRGLGCTHHTQRLLQAYSGNSCCTHLQQG